MFDHEAKTLRLVVATSDPLQLVDPGTCRHAGSTTTVGLCWRLEEPLAERVVPRSTQITVTVEATGSPLRFTCDRDRYHGIARRLQVGPNRALLVLDR